MTYRSEAFLALVRKVPCRCRFPHICQGPSVPMHDNSLAGGRGASFKTPDWRTAAGCNTAHDFIDGRRGGWTKDEKRSEWDLAFIATMDYLFEHRMLVPNKEHA